MINNKDCKAMSKKKPKPDYSFEDSVATINGLHRRVAVLEEHFIAIDRAFKKNDLLRRVSELEHSIGSPEFRASLAAKK